MPTFTLPAGALAHLPGPDIRALRGIKEIELAVQRDKTSILHTITDGSFLRDGFHQNGEKVARGGKITNPNVVKGGRRRPIRPVPL